MGVKVQYSLMSQDLKNFQIVFMLGQKEGKRFMEIGKERGEKEKTQSQVEEKEKKI